MKKTIIEATVEAENGTNGEARQFAISTDALSVVITAADIDDAARIFAAGESLFCGCQTAADLSDRAESLGGWVSVEEV